MNSLTPKYKIVLLLKHIIRNIITDYPLDTLIYSNNILSQHLLSFILKVTTDLDIYSSQSALNILNFLESHLVRGAIFPNNFRSLTLELIELLEGISRARSTIIISDII